MQWSKDVIMHCARIDVYCIEVPSRTFEKLKPPLHFSEPLVCMARLHVPGLVHGIDVHSCVEAVPHAVIVV